MVLFKKKQRIMTYEETIEFLFWSRDATKAASNLLLDLERAEVLAIAEANTARLREIAGCRLAINAFKKRR